MKKVLIVTAALLGVAGTAGFLWWKKSAKKLEKAKKSSVETTPEQVKNDVKEDKKEEAPKKEEPKPEPPKEEKKVEGDVKKEDDPQPENENDLVYSMYKTLISDEEYDEFVKNIDSDNIYGDIDKDEPSREDVVHVRQVYDTFTRRERLDFLFEIPKKAYCGKRFSNGDLGVGLFKTKIEGVRDKDASEDSPRYGGFVESMRKLVEIGYAGPKKDANSEEPETWLEGYYFVTYGNDETAMVRIDKEYREGKPLDEHLEEIHERLKRNERIKKTITLRRNRGGGKRHAARPVECEVEDAIFVVRVSFYIDDKDCPMIGITKKAGISVIRWIIKEAEVRGRGNNKYKYNYVLFYDPYSEEEDHQVCTYDYRWSKGKLEFFSNPIFAK